jgi:hypothetical protein
MGNFKLSESIVELVERFSVAVKLMGKKNPFKN